MTPTLLGRWQIRLFLLGTVGVIISVVVGLIVQDFKTPLFVLLYVFLFGIVWDLLYQLITSYRWDRDWPTSFQVAAGIVEGALVFLLLLTGKMPFVPKAPQFVVFLIQYGLIWLCIFVLVQGPLRIFFLNWRYQGGQWLLSRKPQPEYSFQQQPVAGPQYAGGNYQQPAVAGPQYAGGNYQQQPAAAPQFAGGNYQQPPLQPPPFVAGNYQQQAAPQIIRSSNPDPRQIPGNVAGSPALQSYICSCGFASDRAAGKFCPKCGKPKVQQGIS
jgi:hypothetical protein